MPTTSGRTSILDETGDIRAPKGSREWCIAILGETKKTINVLHADATTAGRRLRALKEVEAWKALEMMSWSMLLHELGISDKDAESLINAKKGQLIGDLIASTPEAGPAEGGRPEKETSDRRKLSKGGCDRWIACLKRDHPEILAQLEAGEFTYRGKPSVKAAARAAGIVKPTSQFRTDNVQAAVRSLLRHFTKDEIQGALNEN